MAIRTDLYTVDASVSPRICWIDISVTDGNAKDLYDTLKYYEALPEYMDEDQFCDAGGLEPLDTTTSVGLTVSLYNMQYAFADRTGPEWIICNMAGGNVVAFTDISRTTTLYPRLATAYVSADRTSSSSATSQNQESIEYSSFNGGVWIDQSNGGINDSKQLAGNAQYPVSNFSLANTIITQRGLPRKMFIMGNATLDIGDNIENTTLIGENANRTTITINEPADTLGCEIQEATVSGNLDGNTIIRNSVINNLNYINGIIYNSMLSSTNISLGGVNPAYFIDCMSAEGFSNMPVIDMNGPTNNGSTPLIMHNYSGYIHVKEKTGPCECSVNLSSGTVILDTTCINGSFTVSGDGKVYNELGHHLNSGIINGGLDFKNEANYGGHMHDMWNALGLNPDDLGKGDVINLIKATNQANFNKRTTDEINKVITLYEDDKITVKQLFDYVENANGEIIEITPQ